MAASQHRQLSHSDLASRAIMEAENTLIRFYIGKPLPDNPVEDLVEQIWNEVRIDIRLFERRLLNSDVPLWSQKKPDWFQTFSAEMNRGLFEIKAGTEFWLRWWNDLLKGKNIAPKVIKRISLIDSEDWKLGLEHIATIIAEIEADHAIERTKLGEVIDVNSETGLLEITDNGSGKATVCVANCAKLKEMDELLSQYDNYVGALRGELFLIRRAIEHHSQNPIILHNNAKAACRLLAGNVANGNCPSLTSEPVLELFDATLLDVQMSLQDEPSVVEANAHRPDFSEIANNADIQRLAGGAAREIAGNAEGRLAIEIVEDAQIVADPTQPEVLRAASADALVSRTLRVWAAARAAQARKAIKISAEFTKDASVVAAGVSGLGTGSLAIWDKIFGSSHLHELVQRLLILLT